MPYSILLSRKTYNRGDTIDAADFTDGFVSDAIIEDGQGYLFAAGAQTNPSVSCLADQDTGLAWTGANELLFITGGNAVGVLSQTALGVGTITPDSGVVAHFKSTTPVVMLEGNQDGVETKFRMKNRGSGPDAACSIIMQNCDSAGTPIGNAGLVISANGPGAFQFSDTGFSIPGANCISSASTFQVAVNGTLCANFNASSLELRQGVDLKLGTTTGALQTPNCSIPIKDSLGRTIYLSATY
jgi:hypothetical protein